MSKKKIIIISILIILIIGVIIGIIIFNNKNGISKDNYIGGVEDVDFSSYSTTELTTSETIKSGGIYNLTGSYDGTITVDAGEADVKLVLTDTTITSTNGPAIYIISADNVYIELVGDNTINSTTTAELNGAIYSKSDLCFVGTGSLTITSNYDGIVGKDDLEIEEGTYTITSDDDGIVGKDSVYILNGTFNITSKGDGIKSSNEEEKGVITILGGKYNIKASGDGITSISTLTIEGGEFDITSGSGSSTSYNSTTSMKGIKANGDLTITGGKFNISSTDDAIHTNSNLTIKGGTINVSSGDDGLHADNNLVIDDGTINITKSYEGTEGLNITVNGGDIKIVASDDGFNAAGGDGSSQGRMGSASYNTSSTSALTITGGNIYVNASGDGLDANGNIYITGGTTYVDGPTNNGNGAIDIGDGGSYVFEVTGGTLIAVGTSGMAISPTSGSTVTSVLINTTQAYNGDITLGSITYSPSKAYNSILICSNELKVGNTYTLKINNTDIQSVTLNNTITTSGTTGNMGGPGGGDHGGGAQVRMR